MRGAVEAVVRAAFIEMTIDAHGSNGRLRSRDWSASADPIDIRRRMTFENTRWSIPEWVIIELGAACFSSTTTYTLARSDKFVMESQRDLPATVDYVLLENNDKVVLARMRDAWEVQRARAQCTPGVLYTTAGVSSRLGVHRVHCVHRGAARARMWWGSE